MVRKLKLLIIDPIVNVVLDYFKKTVQKLLTSSIQGGVL